MWKKLTPMLMALVLTVGLCPALAFADGDALQPADTSIAAQGDVAVQSKYTIDDVKAMIDGLSDDPHDYSPSDLDAVSKIVSAYDSLSESDRKTLDTTTGAHSQSYGRILESALWAILSYRAPDNSTDLPDGTYTESTTPKLTSVYSKGKSTSERDRPWSVSSVTVKDHQAFATITVKSTTYPTMMTGGKRYTSKVSGNTCVFENVPIQLNCTFYIMGESSVMPHPIMFSMTTNLKNSYIMHRLYNKYTGEHFYTANTTERDNLVKQGWTHEGDGWTAPGSSKTPVYRLYNPYAPGGDHHYTTSITERDGLVKAGWVAEGTGWFSDDAQSVPLYRQYNPYAQVGTHNYTTSKAENDKLVSLGWREEGIAWYGV